jgi:uncharacterized protein
VRSILVCIMTRLLPIFLPLFLNLSARADEPKAPTGIAGLWEGTLKSGAIELRLGFHIVAKPDGAYTATFDSLDQGAKDLPFDKVTVDGKKVTFEATKLNAVFSGTISGDAKTIAGEWKQGGITIPLEIKRVDKLTEVRRPQLPRPPYPYEQEEVVVDNKAADVKLAGTITKPKGAGPFRAVILISGSGPQDRDETLFNHKPFLVLSDFLTRRGLLVLRYDDRGVGKSTGAHATATTADFAGDVRAELAFLKGRRDVKDVGLIGHSEGAVIAPMVAAGNLDVAFIVMLAGSGLPGDELLLLQGQAILKAQKADEETLAWQRQTQMQLFKLVREGASAKELRAAFDEAMRQAPELVKKEGGAAEATKQQAPQMLTSAWLKFFITYDPRQDLKKTICPVLALNGEKDVQVPARENLDAIETALKAGGNANVSVRTFPGLNHLFQTATTGLPDEYAKIEETMAPIVLEAIGDWVLKVK